MADFDISIDPARDLTVQTVVGEVTAPEIRDAITKYYEGTVTGRILWDFRQASLTRITADEIRGLVRLTQQYADRRPNGKTALLFSSASSFGLGRMFDIPRNADAGTIGHMSFMDEASAVEWLGVAR